MLPESTKSWLNEFDFPKYREAIRNNQEETKKHLADVGIALDSDIAEFYLNFGALTATGWYELLEPRTLRDATDYVHSEFDIPTHFIPLTAHEGGGFSLLDLESGRVYDLTFGEIGDLVAGTLEPVAGSFADYLEWRRNRHNTNAQVQERSATE